MCTRRIEYAKLSTNNQPSTSKIVESQYSFDSEERGTLQGQGHNLGRKTRHAHEPSQPEHPEVEGVQHKAMFPFKLFGASLHLKFLKQETPVAVANLSHAKAKDPSKGRVSTGSNSSKAHVCTCRIENAYIIFNQQSTFYSQNVESQDSFYSEDRGTLQGQGYNLGRKTRHAHEPSQPERPEVEGLQHKAMFPFKLFGASLHLKSLKPEHSVAISALLRYKDSCKGRVSTGSNSAKAHVCTRRIENA